MRVSSIKKKLIEAGVPMDELEINTDCIEISAGYTEENGQGQCDEGKVEKLKKAIWAAIPSFNGGRYTQYGALRLQENYVGMGDYNDPGSKWHY